MEQREVWLGIEPRSSRVWILHGPSIGGRAGHGRLEPLDRRL
jgi:hypothetical protein